MQTPLFSGVSAAGTNLSLFEFASYLLVFCTLNYLAAILTLAVTKLVCRNVRTAAELALIGIVGLTFVPLSLLHTYVPHILIPLLLCVLAGVITGKSILQHYSSAGINFYISSCLVLLAAIIWAGVYVYYMPVSIATKSIICCSIPFLLVALPSKILHLFEQYDVLCRKHWRRPRKPLPVSRTAHRPFVSIHVPTYSEPPEIVIETLNTLAKLDYDNYEVIVLDNNTKNPSLWLPVRQHCERLGGRFRFMHVDNLSGAKGGALNYALLCTDPRASIIGVVDADYHADKHFPSGLIGYFGDPLVGFVQTPHDYRGWQGNLFLRMCYWEYKLFFHTAMVSLSESGAGITVGTMCLIRKEALEIAGGWSEWCVTEDSELAIRIHDRGYSSVYVDTTYGRGLIPDSFEGYKKQRYRWTAGPVQEFLFYHPYLLDTTIKRSKFSGRQRIFHFNHGLGTMLLSFDIVLLLINLAVITSLVVHQEVVAIPSELWITATIAMLVSPILTYMLYKTTVNATPAQIMLQAVANKALSHVVSHAALRTALTGCAKWHRTSKFESPRSYSSALLSTKEEIAIGLMLLAFSSVAYIGLPFQGLSFMLLIGVLYVTASYFAAPVMSLIGIRSLRRN